MPKNEPYVSCYSDKVVAYTVQDEWGEQIVPPKPMPRLRRLAYAFIDLPAIQDATRLVVILLDKDGNPVGDAPVLTSEPPSEHMFIGVADYGFPRFGGAEATGD